MKTMEQRAAERRQAVRQALRRAHERDPQTGLTRRQTGFVRRWIGRMEPKERKAFVLEAELDEYFYRQAVREGRIAI